MFERLAFNPKTIRPSFRRRPESSNKNTPQSGQNLDVVPLAWEFVNHLDTGLRRYDATFSNNYLGSKVR